MLRNSKVKAFTVSELLRENQQGGGGEGLKLPKPRSGLTINARKQYQYKLLFVFDKSLDFTHQ